MALSWRPRKPGWEHSVNWFVTGSRRCPAEAAFRPDAVARRTAWPLPARSTCLFQPRVGVVLWMRHFPTIDKREWLGGWVASGSRSSGKRPYFLSRGRIQMSAIPLWFMAKAAKLGLPNILTAPNLPLRAAHSWRDPRPCITPGALTGVDNTAPRVSRGSVPSCACSPCTPSLPRAVRHGLPGHCHPRTCREQLLSGLSGEEPGPGSSFP